MFFELFTWTISYYDPYDEIERVVKQCRQTMWTNISPGAATSGPAVGHIDWH